MKVILLAAGQSSRVKPIEDKNFIKFCGKALAEHQIRALEKAGFKDILIIVNTYNETRFEELIAKLNPEFVDLSLSTIEQKKPEEGMAGAVMECENFFSEQEQTLIVSSNDILDDSAYKLILDQSLDSDAQSLLLAYEIEKYFPGGYLEIDEKGRIKSIIEKPEIGKEPSNLINIVVHFHKNAKELIKYLKLTNSDRDDRYEKTLDKMIKDGIEIEAVRYKNFWQPLKYPWHVFPVFDHFFDKTTKEISKKAEISDKATIKGDVIIEDGVRIFEGAIINGPCYLGKDVVIANNALVRSSNLEEGCVAGYSTEIARSVLGENVWTHSNYIGDSIIGNNCSFGAGTITGNLRLDEKEIFIDIKGEKTGSNSNKLGLIMGSNVRCGINTTFMPGVKVGSNSFIGAGLSITQDIPEKSYVRGETKLRISENKIDIKEISRKKMK